MPDKHSKRVLILGGGFAGFKCRLAGKNMSRNAMLFDKIWVCVHSIWGRDFNTSYKRHPSLLLHMLTSRSCPVSLLLLPL